MTPKTKQILHNTIEIYKKSADKKHLLQQIKNSLQQYNSIGIGYVQDYVTAGEIFIRIYKNKIK